MEYLLGESLLSSAQGPEEDRQSHESGEGRFRFGGMIQAWGQVQGKGSMRCN